MQQKEYAMDLAGKKLTAVFSDLADQATGSVMVRMGDTTILATAVMSKNKKDGLDYFPLSVDYEERFYAAGKILGGRFNKREGKPSDEAVLSGRIVDRTIRPLFDQHLRNELQVVITVLSIDEENDPDTLAVIGASLALATSSIPWRGPVGAVRLGIKDNQFVINPSYVDREDSELDLLVCGKDGKINMIEAEGKFIGEEKLADGFELAMTEITKLENWQKDIVKEIGQIKQIIEAPEITDALKNLFAEKIAPQLPSAVFVGEPSQPALSSDRGLASKKSIESLKEEWLTTVGENLPEEKSSLALVMFEEKIDEELHRGGLAENKRADGRAMDQLRPLFARAGGISDIVHGTGIFYRGGTHVLSALTLSGPKDSQLLEGMEIRGKKHFMHHYNFPPFSVGETGRLGGMNRRAIGHGALAEKSLRAIIPAREEFPYTIRLVSEALASNGSSSMGSVCGSTLALMDGGVPIKSPVAGIAMGLLLDMENDNNYKILTDIQGPEDHYGDMDFKVAGTKDGVTGIQLDIKVDGIPTKILSEALTMAKKARLEIIDVITTAIPEPRKELKPSAPKIFILKIPVDKIGAVIGPGGKKIQKISADTGAEIEIEDDGSVYITGVGEKVEMAKKTIEDMTREYKVGDRFTGEVTRLMDFGAFVKIGPNTEGLVHVSEMASFRIEKIADYVKLGDIVPVVVKEIDEKKRINLSIKGADPEFIKQK